jgi:hypothetical protein
MPRSPTRRAYARSYYADWRRVAWRRTLQFERRVGLWVSTTLAVVLGIAEWAFGAPVSIPVILLAAVASFVAVFLALWIGALVTTPALLAYHTDRDVEDDKELEATFSVPRDDQGNPLSGKDRVIGYFPTRNAQNRVVSGRNAVGWTPAALRITRPVDATVRRRDLPAVVRLPWGGKLIIKEFIEGGIVLDEKRTHGRMIEFEIYRGDK